MFLLGTYLKKLNWIYKKFDLQKDLIYIKLFLLKNNTVSSAKKSYKFMQLYMQSDNYAELI